MSNQPEISVVVPVFNSGEIIADLTDEIVKVLSGAGKIFEVILVDDRSQDNSWEVITAIKTKHQPVIAVRLSRNYGQQNATVCGLSKANGAYVVTMDDDFQHNPADILKLVETAKEGKSEIIYGMFNSYNYSFWRSFMRILLIGYIKIFDRKYRKGSSFRVLTGRLKDKIVKHTNFEIFIDEVCFWYADKAEYVTVNHGKSRKKSSGYSFLNMLNWSFDIVAFSSTIHLRSIAKIGFFVVFINFLLGLFFLARKLFYKIPVPGYASTIIAILFSTGALMFTLAYIAIYMSNIYQSQNRKPLYDIDDEL